MSFRARHGNLHGSFKGWGNSWLVTTKYEASSIFGGFLSWRVSVSSKSYDVLSKQLIELLKKDNFTRSSSAAEDAFSTLKATYKQHRYSHYLNTMVPLPLRLQNESGRWHMNYELVLPDNVKVHPVLHVSLLKKACLERKSVRRKGILSFWVMRNLTFSLCNSLPIPLLFHTYQGQDRKWFKTRKTNGNMG